MHSQRTRNTKIFFNFFKLKTVIKSSRDLNLICGYFEFELKFEDGTVSNYNFCNIFDRIISTIIKS